MRNCLKIFLLVFTSFMIQFFGSIVFLSIFRSYIVINCNFERSVIWFPWQRVCLRVVLGLKSALKLVEIALNEVFWPRHIPWETGIHQPRFQLLWANNEAFCNRWAVWIFTSDTSFRRKMPKFSCQRRKKRKFHGNRFTSKQRVQDEEIVALESTSSGSGASSLHCQK